MSNPSQYPDNSDSLGLSEEGLKRREEIAILMQQAGQRKRTRRTISRVSGVAILVCIVSVYFAGSPDSSQQSGKNHFVAGPDSPTNESTPAEPESPYRSNRQSMRIVRSDASTSHTLSDLQGSTLLCHDEGNASVSNLRSDILIGEASDAQLCLKIDHRRIRPELLDEDELVQWLCHANKTIDYTDPLTGVRWVIGSDCD